MRGGPNLDVFGSWWGLSPALLILIFPLGFRLTCYYYRKAYYRGFWASPPACAVAEPHSAYTGETRFPLILQNLHRYFFYAALPVAAILTYDTALTFRNDRYEWGHMGLGTLVFLVNIVLIWAYTLSCHSCRHIIGGRLKHFSKHPVRYRLWGWVKPAERPPHAAGLGVADQRRPVRPVRLPGGQRRLHRPEDLLTWLKSTGSSGTWSWSARAAPGCGPRSRPANAAPVRR